MPHGAARVQKKQCETVEAMEEHAKDRQSGMPLRFSVQRNPVKMQVQV